MRDLRGDSTDFSQKKADLECSNLSTDGNPTILDIGITHPLIDTNLNNKSTTQRIQIRSRSTLFCVDLIQQGRGLWCQPAYLVAKLRPDIHIRSIDL